VAVRLADLLAGLSRLADLGFGLQAGEALRSCALATRFARSLDLPDDDVRTAFYTALLHHVGCTGYAHETARLFGDELVLNAAAGRSNSADPRDLFTTFLPLLTGGRPPLERARLALTAVTRGSRFGKAYTTAACEVGRDAARRLRLPGGVQRSVYHVYEEWRGGGVPAGLAGDDLPVGSRLARLTGIAVLFDTIGGVELAVDAVRRRGGGMLDPWMAGRFADRAEALLGEIDTTDPRALVLEAEPDPVVSVPDGQLAEVAATFADLADLKSPSTHGHSSGVAALARGAGERLRLPPAAVADLEVAGLLHDVGRVAVSDVVWEKPGGLNAHEWEQVRLHTYHSERILAGSDRLASLAPHGRDAPRAARRRRLPPRLQRRRAVHAGPDAGGGHAAVARRQTLPAGLSAREVEVLGLVAEGCSNAQIAQRLVISRRTAEHHVQHIYTKIGVSSRAAAALFAMEHHLLSGRDG
jgi:HD-GYP domain-containing protein (c-di-GMP phosphodiesterase class II)/DNA-binding CsgD family transcriptional regulator